jgi:hypothetical protein
MHHMHIICNVTLRYIHREKQTLLMHWLIYRMRNYQVDIEAISLKQNRIYIIPSYIIPH